MIVTHKLKMDLTKRGITPQVDVVQEDKYSRNIQLALWMDTSPYPIPEGCTARIQYRKADGTGGKYDSLPDGTQAWTADGNLLTIRVAPQVCTVPGDVEVTVTLILGDTELSCFALILCVQEVKRGKMESRAYHHVAGFLPQPAAAKVGQYMRVAAITGDGKVAVTETVDLPIYQSDWEEQDTAAPGFVQNRTHWANTVNPYFDNDLTGRKVLPMSSTMNLVRITDYVLMEAECVGAEMAIVMNGQESTGTISSSGVIDMSASFGISCFMVCPDAYASSGVPFVAVVKEPGTVQGLEVSAGTYYLSGVEDDAPMYTSYFSALDGKEIVHKLDNKFIDAEWMATKKEVSQAIAGGITGIENGATSVVDTVLLTAHSEVTVRFDGVEYTCPVVTGEYNTTIGNQSLNGGPAELNTGEPFCIFIVPDNIDTITWCVDYTDSSEHTADILAKAVQANKLPEEYLPESVLQNPDWNTAEGEAGHILNRTHWTDADGTVHKLDNKYIDAEWMAVKESVDREGEWLPETTVNFTSTTSAKAIKNDYTAAFMPGLEPGQRVKVIWDGTEYYLDVKQGSSISYRWFGNGSLYTTLSGSSDNTGEPFCCVRYTNQEALMMKAAEVGEHSISIFGIESVATPVPIPEEFLPEGYSKAELVAAVVEALTNAEEVTF